MAKKRKKKIERLSAKKPKREVKKIKSDKSINIPALELEKYEPRVKEEEGVMDVTRGSTNYAWIGAGQCGGRLVKSFYDLGYRKVIAVNTTHHDLDLLEIPARQKLLMDIGEKGAGRYEQRQRGCSAVSTGNFTLDKEDICLSD